MKAQPSSIKSSDYIFGYGSLINEKSRARTGVTGGAIPVRVLGWRRGWTVPVEGLKMTVLGVRREGAATSNGVLVPVSAGELAKFDAREEGYDRVELARKDCRGFAGEHLPPGGLWLYVPRESGEPTTTCPIVNSYSDVVMAGCLDIGEDFAREFVRTTELWDRPRLDDRAQPRYPRADREITAARLAEIDRIQVEEPSA